MQIFSIKKLCINKDNILLILLKLIICTKDNIIKIKIIICKYKI